MEDVAVLPFVLEKSWQHVLEAELQKPYIVELAAFVEKERKLGPAVYPPRELVFNAFYQTPYDAVKVVIVGQDPYHGPGQAHGLSFSVPRGVDAPPSLQNIFKELEADLHIPRPSHGCLLSWAKQGVLLLNAILTVRQKEPMSHANRGWERFTDAVLVALAEREDPVIFALWGKSAQEKIARLPQMKDNPQHLILTAPHPSPLSAHTGFLGCRHFSKINHALAAREVAPISWALD